jgi:hypothetical protein
MAKRGSQWQPVASTNLLEKQPDASAVSVHLFSGKTKQAGSEARGKSPHQTSPNNVCSRQMLARVNYKNGVLPHEHHYQRLAIGPWLP